MGLTFKKFISKHTGHLDFSKKKHQTLVHNLLHFILSKNKQNIEFMQSPLIGVHKISFTDSDTKHIFDTLNIDFNDFSRDIPKIKGIVEEWKTSTIPANVLGTVLMHKIINEANGNERLLRDVYVITTFKIFTSAYNNYFRYPVEEQVARTVYDKLSRKFIIKRESSNYKVFMVKSEKILKGTTLYDRLKTSDIEEHVLAINAISGSIRQYLHTFFLALLDVLENGDKATLISVIDDTGKVIGLENNNRIYYENIERILMNKDILINRTILDLMAEVLDTGIGDTPEVLETMYTIMHKEPKKILTLIDDIVNSILYYLYQNEFYPPYNENIGTLIIYLKQYVSNSKVKNKDLLAAKSAIQHIIIEELGIHRHQAVVKTSILVIIYLFLYATVLNKD